MMRPFNVKKGEVPCEISTFSSIFPWEDKIGKKNVPSYALYLLEFSFFIWEKMEKCSNRILSVHLCSQAYLIAVQISFNCLFWPDLSNSILNHIQSS